MHVPNFVYAEIDSMLWSKLFKSIESFLHFFHHERKCALPGCVRLLLREAFNINYEENITILFLILVIDEPIETSY